MKKHLYVVFCLIASVAFAQNDTLINSNAVWRYLDNGSDQGTAWQSVAFNDAAWASGAAQLGYGEGDEATVVSYGTAGSNKYITTYFRKTISVANASSYTALQLHLLRDDGAVVYINGTQVAVSNMPAGSIIYSTKATANVLNANENKYFIFNLSPSLLVNGDNVIAVELHQFKKTNDDLSFNLRLIAAGACGKPTGLNATNITDNAAQLNWNAVAGAASYSVQYRLNGTTAWTTVTATTTSSAIIGLNATAAYQYRVKANCGLTTSAYSSISNFTTTAIAVCDIPASLSTTNITTTSATFNWSVIPNAIGYTIQYRLAGSGTWMFANAATNSFDINSLTPSSNYEWQIEAVCSFGSSGFSSSANFTTGALPVCSIPDGLNSTNVTTVDATLNWNSVANAVGYTLQYRIVGSGTWTTLSTSANYQILTALAPSSNYEWQVEAVCSFGSSGFSAMSSFITNAIPVCDVPVGSGTSNITPASATLSWNITGNAISYNVQYRLVGSGTWMPLTSATNSINLTSLLSASNYEWQVQSVCSFGVSNFSSSANFSTPAPPVCDSPVGLAVSGIATTSASLSWVSVPAAVSYNIQYRTIGGSWISTTSATNSKTISGLTSARTYEWQVQTVCQYSNSNFSPSLSFTTTQTAVTVQRGPYLQMLTPGSIHIRWKTDVATNTRLRFGSDMSYGNVIDSSASATEHEVKITGLSPNTNYYYTIGSSSADLQGNQNNYFKTSLPTGSTLPFRVWATGDFGNNSSGQDAVRNAYVSYAAAYPANLWIWLGDNAYNSGTEAEYNSYVFAKYPSQLKNIPLYPSIGNHDYANVGYQSASALGTNFQYFSLFTCPKNGEGGGTASATEKYYSYNYGNTHFIALDSYGSMNNSGSAMYTWLQNDLAANTQRWTVCYWHHPPYTMGTHTSDTESESVNMRQNIIPLLESFKVDLVLCGHSHVYERSFLLNGHYGLEGSLTGAMKIDAGSGDAPYYLKSSPNFSGTVYAVVGNSGQGGTVTTAGSWPHAAMYSYSKTLYGSMILDLNSDTLSAKFLTSTGTIYDQFKIVKSGINRFTESTFSSENENSEIEVFPNPFSNETIIRYHLAEESNVAIEVFDLTGRKIYSFTEGETAIQYAGTHEVALTNKNLENKTGLFVVRITTNNKVINKIVERME